MTMIEINLLPKGYLKSGKGFNFGKAGMYVAAGVAAVVIALAGITFYQFNQLAELNQNIETAEKRALQLRQDINLVNNLTDVKAKIEQRMRAVERLDRYRTAWVRVLEDVAGNVPEFVWLAKFSDVPNAPTASVDAAGAEVDTTSQSSDEMEAVRNVEIEGYTFTLNALAAFMIKMMRSDYFNNVELTSTAIKEFRNEEQAYQFIINCDLLYMSDEELQQLADGTASAGDAPQHAQLN